ncbi:MAG: glycosyltransferase family 39 protein, partial [Candidatus Eremiobacteraeota bacterium]|nr:glycosyltransferase family 39 protein [Candidatus Eremiobacteraeota bacterium]
MSIRFPWYAAGVVFIIHALGNPHYGFFRDELYFIVCGRHPQWGYVDQPPVVPLLAAATQAFGHSLFLLRLVPAFFAAAGAYTTCLLAIEFGGGSFAQLIASLTFLFSLVLLSFGGKVGPDEVGLWTWPLLALLVVRIIKGGSPKIWIWAGIVAGLSIESKYSVLFFLIALTIG